MFEDVCYKKSYLAEVVARIDLLAPVEAFEKNISGKILNKIKAKFPIAEPTESIAQHFEFAPDGVKQKELRGKQWNFFGKEREKQLTIDSGALYVRYTKYSRFEDLVEEFQLAVNAIDQEHPNTSAKRFGLRYINQFDIGELTLSNSRKYFSESLLGTQSFGAYERQTTRNFHIVELKFGDMNLRFQYGFPNADFPAIIKRPVFIIDIDAYSVSVISLGEALQNIEIAHGHIQKLFEESITTDLRSGMND